MAVKHDRWPHLRSFEVLWTQDSISEYFGSCEHKGFSIDSTMKLILEHVIHPKDIAIIYVCKQTRGYMRKRRITAGNWLGSWHLEKDLDHQHYHHQARAIMSFTLSLSPPSPILQPSHLFCWKTWEATSARTNARSGQLRRHVVTSLMQNT